MADDTDDDVTGTGNDARLKLFSQIADNADKVRSADFEDVDETEEVRNLPYKLALDDEGEVVGATELKPIVEDAEHKKYKLKVNGEEKELSEQEVIALAQKVAAADEYLRQAKEAAERFDQMKLPPASAVTPEPSKPDVQEDDAALARALQMGTEEEAAQVIKRLRTSIQPDEVAARAATEALNRLSFQSAFDQFKKDYKDIVDDPNLFQLALAKDQQLLQSGDKRAYADRYRSIGDELRTWAGKTKPASTFEDKEQRKSATVTPIRPASVRASQPPEDDMEESPSETIARMARARGQ